jgi:hypothetical protein
MNLPHRTLIHFEEDSKQATYRIIFAGSGPDSNLFLIRLLASRGIVRSGQDWILPDDSTTDLIDLQAGKIHLPTLNVNRYARKDVRQMGFGPDAFKAFLEGKDVYLRIDKTTGESSVVISSRFNQP